jgi:hypothetical protein
MLASFDPRNATLEAPGARSHTVSGPDASRPSSPGSATLSTSVSVGVGPPSSKTAVSSTSGQRWVWIEAHGSPAAASRRDQSSSVMCGAAGASISSSSRTASSHSGSPATDVPR